VNLSNANLNNTKLSSANLQGVNLSNAFLGEADLKKSDLSNANLTGANLSGADLSRTNLSSVNLMEANLEATKLRTVSLDKMNLSALNLADVDLTGASLVEAKLRNACLRGANLEKASLQKADLMKANLNGANLKNADLTDAKTYGMNFENADLSGTIMPDGERYNQEATQKNSQLLIPTTRKVIFTDKAPFPVGANSQAIAASGQFIFVAGQIAIDLRMNGIVYPNDVAKQTVQVMTNIGAILAATGATFQDIVKTTVCLADINDFAAMNAVYATYFDERTAPARECMQISQLPQDVLVEIGCIAVIEPQ
jgi:2-iminobutanoate/2-iminopropanoate deaminase